MTARKTRQRALVLAASVLTALVPRVARTATCPGVDVNLSSEVHRYTGSSDTAANEYPVRGECFQPNWVDVQDCKNDVRLEFALSITGLPCKDAIQVWAGTIDCTQTSARDVDSGKPRCWPVAPAGAVAAAASSTVDIRAQDIVAFVGVADPPTTYSAQNASACQSLADETAGVGLGLYFMAIDADGGAVEGTSAEYDFGVEPDPPDGGPCGYLTDGGEADAAQFTGGTGGCRVAPGRSSSLGLLMGVGGMALVVGRRRRRGRVR